MSVGPRPMPRLEEDEFVALLNLLICSDPFPDGVDRGPIERLLNQESQARGLEDWVVALHEVG